MALALDGPIGSVGQSRQAGFGRAEARRADAGVAGLLAEAAALSVDEPNAAGPIKGRFVGQQGRRIEIVEARVKVIVVMIVEVVASGQVEVVGVKIRDFGIGYDVGRLLLQLGTHFQIALQQGRLVMNAYTCTAKFIAFGTRGKVVFATG